MNIIIMTLTPRSVPQWLAGIVEELELERPRVVTPDVLREICERRGVDGSVQHIRNVTRELDERGWLLKTGAHGAWEFAPGERAGSIPSGDLFLALRATLATAPDVRASVALGSALWLLDISDRAPDRHEIALPGSTYVPIALRRAYRTVRHDARLEPAGIDELPVHRPATVLVRLAAGPTDVRSWGSVLECLPGLLDASPEEEIRAELEGRPRSTHVRLACLIAGLAPDLVERLGIESGDKVWFGPRRALLRHDARWQVADTVLPYPPPRSSTGE
jgi:hypothetical protein